MNFSYKEQLNQALTNHRANNSDLPRLAVIGIGNEFNGDDAAGVLVIRHIQRLLPHLEQLIFIDAAVAPENFTGILRKFNPDWVWLIDAADMGEKAGTIQLLDWQTTQGVSAFTHGLPPTLFARFVLQEFGARIFLFGIQPAIIDAFVKPSLIIQKAVRSLAVVLIDWLHENYYSENSFL